MISSINIPLISEEYPNSWHSKQSRTPLWCLLLLFLFVVFLLFVYAGILVENMYIRLSFLSSGEEKNFFLQSRVFKLHFFGIFYPLWIHVFEKMRDWDIGAKLPIRWLVKILGTLSFVIGQFYCIPIKKCTTIPYTWEG